MTDSRENVQAVTRHLLITGRVQGVGFRAFVHRHAGALGLDGFVRNREDGSVEALVSGRKQQVEELIALCRKGSAASKVEYVDVKETGEKAGPGFRHL